jgi:hypothetical protein
MELENGTGVMISGMTFGYHEIDDVGGSFKELVDVLAEVGDEQEKQKLADAPSALIKASREKKMRSKLV